jgi:hypothetical protein
MSCPRPSRARVTHRRLMRPAGSAPKSSCSTVGGSGTSNTAVGGLSASSGGGTLAAVSTTTWHPSIRPGASTRESAGLPLWACAQACTTLRAQASRSTRTVDVLKWHVCTWPWKRTVIASCGASFSAFFRTLENPRRFSVARSPSCSRYSISVATSRAHSATSAGGRSGAYYHAHSQDAPDPMSARVRQGLPVRTSCCSWAALQAACSSRSR